jgi:hypothetical protein
MPEQTQPEYGPKQYTFGVRGPDPFNKTPIDRAQISAFSFQMARQYKEIKNVLAELRRDIIALTEKIEDIETKIKWGGK